jgi:hypothetical protein
MLLFVIFTLFVYLDDIIILGKTTEQHFDYENITFTQQKNEAILLHLKTK